MADITGMLQAAAGTGQQYLALSVNQSPYIVAYPWSNNGFGAKYSDPSTLPVGVPYSVKFNPGATAVAVVTNDPNPGFAVYPWSSSGFGAKYSDPAVLPPAGGGLSFFDVEFHPNNNAIVFGGNRSDSFAAYAWSASGFGSKLSTPSSAFTNDVYGLSFNPSGNAIAAALGQTPFVGAWAWSGSGFGTRFSNPSTLPPMNPTFDNATSTMFSPDGAYVAFGTRSLSTTVVVAYSWSGAGFGTYYDKAPASISYPNSECLAYAPDNKAIAVGINKSPYIVAFGWDTTAIIGSPFTTQYSNPATLPPSTVNGVSFNNTSEQVAVAHGNSPYLTAYAWNSASGFGTKFSNPATLPTSAGTGINFGST